MLYFALIDNMKMADTVISCSQFDQIFKTLQKINPDTRKSPLADKYQVLKILISSVAQQA